MAGRLILSIWNALFKWYGKDTGGAITVLKSIQGLALKSSNKYGQEMRSNHSSVLEVDCSEIP